MHRLTKPLAALAAATVLTASASAAVLEYFNAAETVDLLEDSGFKNLTLSQDLRYYDNYKDSHDRKKSNYESETTLSSNIHFLDGPIKLGLSLEGGYKYAKDKYDDDDRGFNYDIQPIIGINVGTKDKLVISLKSQYHTTKIDNADTEEAAHNDTSLNISYDYCPNDKLGVILSNKYRYDMYEHKYNYRTKFTVNASVAPYYKFSEKLRTGVETAYAKSIYKNSRKYNDSYEIIIDSFVDYRMSDKFTTHVSVGASQMFYEDEAEDLNGDREWTPIYNVTFDYKAYENLSFSLSSTIENEDSSNTRSSRRSWDNSFGADWELSSKLELSQNIGFSREDELNSNYDNDTYSYDVRLTYKFSQKITAHIGWEHDLCKYKYVDSHDYRSNEYYIGMDWHF